MSTTNDGGKHAKCSVCLSDAVFKQGNQWLCPMHYRIGQMIQKAKRSGKAAPTKSQIQAMVSECGMVCVGCGRKMYWMGRENQKQVATLQHNRNGSMNLLCRSCNTRHATFDGDDFYSTPKDSHVCRCCGKLKAKSEFNKDKSRPLGVRSYCKSCSSIKYKSWWNNRAESMLKAREK